LNPNKGECVPDFLRYKLFTRNKAAVSGVTLIKHFGEDYRDGIKLSQITEYCKSFILSLHVFSIFGEVIYRRIAARGSLCFFINNYHIYPITE